MTVTPAQIKATSKFNKERYDTLSIRIPKGQKERYKLYAAKNNESLAAFIIRAAEEAIIRDLEKQKDD